MSDFQDVILVGFQFQPNVDTGTIAFRGLLYGKHLIGHSDLKIAHDCDVWCKSNRLQFLAAGGKGYSKPTNFWLCHFLRTKCSPADGRLIPISEILSQNISEILCW